MNYVTKLTERYADVVRKSVSISFNKHLRVYYLQECFWFEEEKKK